MKTKVHKGLTWLLSLCMAVMLLPVSVLAEEESAVVNVSTAAEFQAAVQNTEVKTINITGSFDTTQKLVVSRPVTINGNSKTITFTDDENGWQGNYVLQVYNTTNVTISNIKLTGGDAALCVNGSTATLTGTIDVSGNAFGGIEAGKGSGVETQPKLTVTGATLVNDSEAYGQPTVWEDGVDANRVIGGTFAKITKGSQPQYYLVERNATAPGIADLTIVVNSDGAISGDEATNSGNLSYYLVSTDKQETINGWNVETSSDAVADALEATAKEGKPTLTTESNGKYLVVVEAKGGKVVAAGQSEIINIEANVSTAAEFQEAVQNTEVTTINITENFYTAQTLVVNRSVTINGNSKTITFTSDEVGWQGNYVLQVYNTTNVTISNINLTGGDAALCVNGSTVTLTGTIDVSNNAFGGIEAGKGFGVETQPELTVTDATLVNSTEAYGLPTIWEDGVEDNRVSGGGTFTKITKGSQPQYYLIKRNAVDPDIAALTGVTVSGTAKVGETLTAAVAPEEATATYQWQKADTADGEYTAIAGATDDSTYVLTADEQSKFIKVVATGTGDYSGEVTSNATTAVAAADPETTALTGVTVSGTAKVGETLTAVVAPEGATVSYQWQKADTADGEYTDIADATNSTYALSADDLGKFIKVVATGTGDYSGEVTSDATTAVVAADPEPTALTGVAVSGTVKVGETLTAAVAPEEATATYQWQKADAADGEYTDITGATDSTYALSADDLGKFIKVVATGTGDYSGEVTSDATTAVAAADPEPTTLTGVTVSGTVKVGETLTAAIAPEGATATYQWQKADAADGEYTDIADATSSTYALSADDLGKFIKVVATGTGDYSGEVTSDATTAVAIDSPYTITEIGAEAIGGAGITRTITTNGTDGNQYLVVQMTEGTGANAHVSVVMVKANDSIEVSYKTTAAVQVWLTNGMPALNGSEATGVTIFDTKTAE